MHHQQITTLAKIIDRHRLVVIFIGRDENNSWHFLTKRLSKKTLVTSKIRSAFTEKTLEMISEMIGHLSKNPPQNGEIATAIALEEKI